MLLVALTVVAVFPAWALAHHDWDLSSKAHDWAPEYSSFEITESSTVSWLLYSTNYEAWWTEGSRYAMWTETRLFSNYYTIENKIDVPSGVPELAYATGNFTTTLPYPKFDLDDDNFNGMPEEAEITAEVNSDAWPRLYGLERSDFEWREVGLNRTIVMNQVDQVSKWGPDEYNNWEYQAVHSEWRAQKTYTYQ